MNLITVRYHSELPLAYLSGTPKLAARPLDLKIAPWCTWVAQSVKHQTFDFRSGHNLRVIGLSPALGPMLGVKPA